jgi:hypothetical protein
MRHKKLLFYREGDGTVSGVPDPSSERVHEWFKDWQRAALHSQPAQTASQNEL